MTMTQHAADDTAYVTSVSASGK